MTSKVAIALCQLHLEHLVSNTTGITAALVATADGFEVASVTRDAFSVPKLAAITSSLHALGDAVVSEAGLTNCNNVIIEAHKGKVLLMSIPTASHSYLLSVICNENAVLGQILYACKECAQRIADRMQLM